MARLSGRAAGHPPPQGAARQWRCQTCRASYDDGIWATSLFLTTPEVWCTNMCGFLAMLLYFHYHRNMEEKEAIKAFAALAQDHRLHVFRLLVRHAPQGLPAGHVARRKNSWDARHAGGIDLDVATRVELDAEGIDHPFVLGMEEAESEEKGTLE